MGHLYAISICREIRKLFRSNKYIISSILANDSISGIHITVTCKYMYVFDKTYIHIHVYVLGESKLNPSKIYFRKAFEDAPSIFPPA